MYTVHVFLFKRAVWTTTWVLAMQDSELCSDDHFGSQFFGHGLYARDLYRSFVTHLHIYRSLVTYLYSFIYRSLLTYLYVWHIFVVPRGRLGYIRTNICHKRPIHMKKDTQRNTVRVHMTHNATLCIHTQRNTLQQTTAQRNIHFFESLHTTLHQWHTFDVPRGHLGYICELVSCLYSLSLLSELRCVLSFSLVCTQMRESLHLNASESLHSDALSTLKCVVCTQMRERSLVHILSLSCLHSDARKSTLRCVWKSTLTVGEKEVSLQEIRSWFEFVPGLFGIVLRGGYLYGVWPRTVRILIEFKFIVPELWQLVVFCTCRILPEGLKFVENFPLRSDGWKVSCLHSDTWKGTQVSFLISGWSFIYTGLFVTYIWRASGTPWVYHRTLQHTATHCNTLQHTATHCNIRFSRALIRLCNSTPMTYIWYASGTPWVSHLSTQRNTLQHTATHYNTLQHMFFRRP